MALITATEVITIASPRHIQPGHIMSSDIVAAELELVRDAVGQALYDAIVTNTGGTYTTTITNYIKPVLAYGILANNWYRFTAHLTERGINQLTGEGIQGAPVELVRSACAEYRQRLGTLIKNMISALSIDPLYVDQDYQVNEITYSSIQNKRNNAL